MDPDGSAWLSIDPDVRVRASWRTCLRACDCHTHVLLHCWLLSACALPPCTLHCAEPATSQQVLLDALCAGLLQQLCLLQPAPYAAPLLAPWLAFPVRSHLQTQAQHLHSSTLAHASSSPTARARPFLGASGRCVRCVPQGVVAHMQLAPHRQRQLEELLLAHQVGARALLDIRLTRC